MMQRQLQGRRRLVQCSRQRSRLLSSPATATIVRQPMTAPPLQPPVVVSRQGWQAYRTKHPVTKKEPSASDKKTASDDMPWPKSVVYGSYAAACTLIPYFGTWYISANPTLREMVQPHLSVSVQEFIRGHFGKPDLDAMSYADVTEGDEENGESNTDRDVFHKIPIPHILPHEFTEKVRREQQAIQAQAEQQVNVKIQVVDDSDSFMRKQDVNVQKVPGSTPARVEALLALITAPSTSTTTTTEASKNKADLPAIAVDFLPDDDDDDADDDAQDNGTSSFSVESSSLQSMDSTEWNDSSGSSSSTSTDTLATVGKTKTVDPLQQTAHIFSSWHYQPPANVPNTVSGGSSGNKGSNNSSNNNAGTVSSGSSKSGSSSVSMDDIERSRLEYTIAELQHNLKDPNCLRSVDDMMDELKVAKAELSKLKWNKWGWK